MQHQQTGWARPTGNSCDALEAAVYVALRLVLRSRFLGVCVQVVVGMEAGLMGVTTHHTTAGAVGAATGGKQLSEAEQRPAHSNMSCTPWPKRTCTSGLSLYACINTAMHSGWVLALVTTACCWAV